MRHEASEKTEALRRAITFDPARVRAFTEAGAWSHQTVGAWLEERAATAPRSPVMIAGERTIAYGEALESARRIAGGLLSLGLRKRDVLAVQLPNTPEYLLTYFAAALIGIVMAPIHAVYDPREIEPLLRHGRADAVVVAGAESARGVAAVAHRLPQLKHIIALGTPPRGALAWEELTRGGAPEDTALPAAVDPLHMAFTSGTAASPKAVLVNHHTALGTIIPSTPLLGLRADDIIVSLPAFSHMFGMAVLHLALHCGGALLLLPQFRPDIFVETLCRKRATFLFAAPAHLAACLKAGLFEGRDLSSLRAAYLGGAVCPPELAGALEKLLPNGTVNQIYGMTEAMLISFTLPGDPQQVRFHTVGRVVPGQEVRVVSQDGTPLSPGEEGEIQVRGSGVLASYIDNPDATGAAFAEDRWLRTGDLGRLDHAGNVAISGRLKDIINRGGVKINPADIEMLINAHPSVEVAALLGVPDEVLGERICCFVQLKPGGSLTLDELCAWLGEQGLAKRKWPERLEIVERMPLTPTRKVIKGRLRQEGAR
jgi:acyl-CoA synthetase (AMP-forming)/AMP-acid ligase II